MSIATIDRETYSQIFLNTVNRYLKNGLAYNEAIQRAQELMDNAFVIGDTTLADELDQKESGIYG